MKLSHSLLLTLPLASSWAVGADLSVKFELPRLNVAEYHKPYVAIWIERADQTVASNLAVLYDVKMKNREGEKWLKDLRTWWRKAGRDATMPIDGVSGATRPPGAHTMKFDGARTGLDKLPAGDYTLVVEASRESGGREVVKLPFNWTGKGKVAASAAGKDELGAVSLQIQ
ncbi:DUF2271 domain-containing protein [Massilia sp. BSC265]|uniref:DUF2271 domain-containing protein n=1 Tax=Massilia sp. BSC265 TaxID=1549812 RepID=UPI0004E8EE9E|nr:DUF2271 domain-containing protein [Massilia sp. BSC265]KFI06762.1 hypothetical protein JN27_13890 [Massilia sp. BSC265]